MRRLGSMIMTLLCASAALALLAVDSPASTAPACTAGQLRATFTHVRGSNGAGNVSYTLSIRNVGAAPCRLSAPFPERLLGRTGTTLPTHATTAPPGPYTVRIPAHGVASATARFSPDVPGPGEGARCEPTAYWLRLRIGARFLRAPIRAPTPVCEHGQMAFERLRAG